MRKWVFAVAMAFMTMVAVNGSMAIAAEGFYMGIQGGAVDLEDAEAEFAESEMDTGYAVSGVAGYDFGYFRLEAEATYRENDIDKVALVGNETESSGEVASAAFMVNGYLDLENRTALTPYVGAGIGYARVDFEGSARYRDATIKWDDDDSGLAYQLMAGIAWDVLDSLVLDLSYRYFASDDIEAAGTSNYGVTLKDDIDYESHNFMIGLRWYF
ncbi:MAG: outer membrane protein [Desulfobacterales bacterium]